MKRTVKSIAALCLLALPAFFSGCSARQKLYIYNWTYYIPEDVVTDFEREYSVDVTYDTFASNEEMYAKLKAGGSGYDVVFPSGDFVSIMIAEGMLEEIDKSRLPNFANLDPTVVERIRFDAGNRYSVPYWMGAAGISVNKTKVASYDRSWSLFGREDLAGRLTMLDDMREVIGDALKHLGYSVNSVDPDELAEAKALIETWKPNIVKFDSEAFAKSFAAGEFYAVQGYAENVFKEYDPAKASEVDFFIPKEGGPMYMDSMCVLKGARNRDLAYKFMNYILRPEIAARIADYLLLPSPNVPSRALMKNKPNYTFEDMANCEFKEDLGANIELYNKIWQEIRVGD